MIETLKRGVSAVRARNSTFATRWPSPGRTTTARSQMEGYDTVLVSDGHTTDEGPWDLDLPDGSTVPIGAREMIAFTNFFVADTEYPGVTTEVVPAAEVTW